MPLPYKGVLSETFDQSAAKFLNSGGKISVHYNTSPTERSHYDANTNTLVMVDNDVRLTAQKTDVGYDQAYAQILTHELGHWVNDGFDFAGYVMATNTAEFKAWYYSREAAAAIFSTAVTAEVRDKGGAFSVAGTSQINDLFTKVNDAAVQAYGSNVTDIFGKMKEILSTHYANDANYSNAASAAAAADNRINAPAAPYYPAELGNSYADYSAGGCVEVNSFTPGGKIAKNVQVGTELELSDESTLEASLGIVSYSEKKKAPGYKITTENGITLICSDTAPIPTKNGIVLAPKTKGEFVATRIDLNGKTSKQWSQVISVNFIGDIEVQHITVGNRSFWAGKEFNKYILHHNRKMVPGGGDEGGGWWDSITPEVSAIASSGHFDEFGRPTILVGVQTQTA